MGGFARAVGALIGSAWILLAATLPAAGGPLVFEGEIAVPSTGRFWSYIPTDIASAGDEVRIAWQGQVYGTSRFDWGYAVSSDRGRTFRTLESPFPGPSADHPWPHVASLGSASFAYVWLDGNRRTLAVAIEEPETLLLGPYYPLTGIGSDWFDIAAEDGYLYVAWIDASSQNGTLRFSVLSPEGPAVLQGQVIDDDPLAFKSDVRLAVRGGEAFVVWRRSAQEVVFSHGSGNASWTVPAPVWDEPGPYQWHPTVAVSNGGTLFVAFDSLAAQAYGLRAAVADAPYETFTPLPEFQSAIGADITAHPEAAFDSEGRLNIVWLDGDLSTQTGGFKVHFARAESGWSSFEPLIRVDGDLTTVSKSPPLLSFGSDRVFVAWGRGSSQEARFARSVATPTSLPEDGGPQTPEGFSLWTLVVVAMVAAVTASVVTLALMTFWRWGSRRSEPPPPEQ